MKLYLDCRFIRPDGHSGGERYVRELARGLLDTASDMDFTSLVSEGVDAEFGGGMLSLYRKVSSHCAST